MNYFEDEFNADNGSCDTCCSDYERLCLSLTYLYDLDEEGMNEY